MTEPRIWHIDLVVAARPNFVKIAPIMRAFTRHTNVMTRLIHTGQHYDDAMNEVFFDELAIPRPALNLAVRSGTHTEQTARVMMALEPVFLSDRPDVLIVVGDVNSTLAATLVAAKLCIPVAHVEAGLRSFDRTMPEEINRLVTDRLSDLLFATERAALDNLARENNDPDRVVLVGNVMIDTLRFCLARAVAPETTFAELGADTDFLGAQARSGFAFATLHRPSNVDDPKKLSALIAALANIAARLPVIFPIHPRTRGMLAQHGLSPMLAAPGLLTAPPLSYLRAVGLIQAARVVMTDSGGVQEETTALGVPCLTLRDNTERPITISEGTNTLLGSDPAALAPAVEAILAGASKAGRIPALWDGAAAERIAEATLAFLARRH